MIVVVSFCVSVLMITVTYLFRPKPAYNPYSTRYDQKKYDIPYRMRHFRRSQLTEVMFSNFKLSS